METPTPACLTCGSRITGPLALDTCTACRLEAALVDPIAEDPEAPGLAPGVLERLGDYELLEEIGRGGMGVIYKARQVHLRRIVAIKMLLAGEFADATTRRRLLREAQAAAQLQHPNIVAVHDVGESNGRAYFVMEYVPGRNLSQAMRESLFPIARSARYVRELATAIQYAHDRGVVHRDLKPSNILLDPEDRLKLADFGLNKWLAEDSEAMTTVSSGTPSFMAPEQVQGVHGISGKHTDIFGLGGILYFLLAGRPPFIGSTIAETLRAVLESDPVPPSSIRPGIPRDLEAVCMKCLEKEPARRYLSATELAEDLDRWINHLPVRAKPSTPLDHSLKWLRRRPLVAALGAACVLSLTCGAAGIVWQWRKAVAHAASAELHSYLAGVNLAHTDWRENNLGRMRETLAELHASRDRGIEWDLLYKWANAAQLTIQAYPVGINAVSISPDGSTIATVGMETSTTLWEFPSGKFLRNLEGHQAWIASVAFSPDGRRVASGGGDHHIVVWSIDTGETLRFIHEAHAHIVRGLAWTPDGSRLLSAGFDGSTCIWDANTGARLVEMPSAADQVPALGLACSPDGRQVLTGHGDGTSRLRSTTDGHEIVVFREQTGAINTVAFHPSGQQVASGSSDGTICVWNAANGQLIHHFKPGQGIVLGLAFSHDGTRLASAHRERVALVWDLGTGRELLGFRGHALDLNAVAFSKDDRQLITGSVDGTLRFLDATSDPRGKLLADAASEPVSMGISPDGNLVAVAHRSGVIHGYDSATQQRVFTLPGTSELGSMTFLPRSGRILTIGLNGMATIWDPSTRSILQDWDVGLPGALILSVSPNEEWLATIGPASAAGVWNLRTHQRAFTYASHEGTVYSASFSPDSRQLLTCGEDWTARIWEVPSGKETLRVEKHENVVLAGAFSPDGQTCLTSSSDGTVVLWDAHSGHSLHRYDSRTVGSRRVRTEGGVHEVGFLADGSRIHTADNSGVIHLWHPTLQKETLRLPLDGLPRVQVDPRNRFLLTRSSEVRLWPTATPEESTQWLADQAKATRQP